MTASRAGPLQPRRSSCPGLLRDRLPVAFSQSTWHAALYHQQQISGCVTGGVQTMTAFALEVALFAISSYETKLRGSPPSASAALHLPDSSRHGDKSSPFPARRSTWPYTAWAIAPCPDQAESDSRRAHAVALRKFVRRGWRIESLMYRHVLVRVLLVPRQHQTRLECLVRAGNLPARVVHPPPLGAQRARASGCCRMSAARGTPAAKRRLLDVARRAATAARLRMPPPSRATRPESSCRRLAGSTSNRCELRTAAPAA